MQEVAVIEAIVVPKKNDNIDLRFSADVFERMKSLRLLHVYHMFTCAEPTSFPDELRSRRWDHYPFSSLPIAHMDELVLLEMFNGSIKHLWKGRKVFI